MLFFITEKDYIPIRKPWLIALLMDHAPIPIENNGVHAEIQD